MFIIFQDDYTSAVTSSTDNLLSGHNMNRKASNTIGNVTLPNIHFTMIYYTHPQSIKIVTNQIIRVTIRQFISMATHRPSWQSDASVTINVTWQYDDVKWRATGGPYCDDCICWTWLYLSYRLEVWLILFSKFRYNAVG